MIGEKGIEIWPLPSPQALDDPDMIYRSTKRLAQLPGKFCYLVFAKRNSMFHMQQMTVQDGEVVHIHCDFYERSESAEDSFLATQASEKLAARGLPLGAFPVQELVVKIFPSIYDAPDGVVPMPEADEPFIGDHVVWALAVDGDRLHFLNCWGPDWGNKGFGSFSKVYVEAFYREGFSNRKVGGPLPIDDVSWESRLGPDRGRIEHALMHEWNSEQDSTFMLINKGRTIDVHARWLTGMSDGAVWLQTVAVIRDMESGKPFIAGWMHIRGTLEGPVVEELFVWPLYRKRGIATALAGQTLFHAARTTWQHQPLAWRESEADAVVRKKSPDPPRIPRWLRGRLEEPQRNTSSVEHATLFDNLTFLAKREP